MKTSTKRILSIGLAGLFFIGTLVVYASFIRPQMDQISEKRALSLSKETLFNNQKTAVSEVQKLIAKFQSIVKLEEAVSLALPIGENTTQVLNQIQAIVRMSQVGLRSLALKPEAFESSREPLAKRLGVLIVNLAVDGTYENIKSFIRSLEINVRIANIKNMTVTPFIGTENYSLALSVEVYYQEKSL